MLLCAHFDESIHLLARQSEGQSKAELWQNVAQVARVTRAAAFFVCVEGLQTAGPGEGGRNTHTKKETEGEKQV